MISTAMKGALVPVLLPACSVALMAGQSVAGVILLLSAFVVHRV